MGRDIIQEIIQEIIMPYVVLVHATFDNKADADHIYNQAKSVATTASVARIGDAGERTSHCGVFDGCSITEKTGQ